MVQGVHRWCRIVLRGLALAFLIALALPARAWMNPADCPPCRDLIERYNAEEKRVHSLQDDINEVQLQIDRLHERAGRGALSAADQQELARLNERLDKLTQQWAVESRQLRQIYDLLEKCLQEKCSQLNRYTDHVPQADIPSVKTCPPCSAVADAVTQAMRVEADARLEVERLKQRLERVRALVPATESRAQAIAEVTRDLEQAQKRLEEATRQVLLARMNLAACERARCGPGRATQIQPSSPGKTLVCPPCQGIADKIDERLEKVHVLQAEVESLRARSSRSDNPAQWEGFAKDVEGDIRKLEQEILELLGDLRECIRTQCQPGNLTLISPHPSPFKPRTQTRCFACIDLQYRINALEKLKNSLQTRLETLRVQMQALPMESAEYQSGVNEAKQIEEKLKEIDPDILKGKAELQGCEKEKCPPPRETGMLVPALPGTYAAYQVQNVANVSGNNPFDPRNPLGGSSPSGPTTCTTPRPSSETQVQGCPAGQTGSITQTRTFSCSGTTWVPGPFVVTSNTCTTTPQTCTTPQPPAETQTVQCPAGQTGSITQTRTYSCIGTTWVAGPFTTTSNTCTTPAATGCATNFSSGSYSCSGSCGINGFSLVVTPGSSIMTGNGFGANGSLGFNCSGPNATTIATSLIILGQSGHTCSLVAQSFTAFTLNCRNTSGGTCSSSCSR